MGSELVRSMDIPYKVNLIVRDDYQTLCYRVPKIFVPYLDDLDIDVSINGMIQENPLDAYVLLNLEVINNKKYLLDLSDNMKILLTKICIKCKNMRVIENIMKRTSFLSCSEVGYLIYSMNEIWEFIDDSLFLYFDTRQIVSLIVFMSKYNKLYDAHIYKIKKLFQKYHSKNNIEDENAKTVINRIITYI